MASSSFVLLPEPVPSSALVLGQLLPNPLAPLSASFVSPSTLQADHLSESLVQSQYRDIISVDHESRLAASLNGLELGTTPENVLHVQADEMEYKSLKQPNITFDSICQDPAAQQWIQEMALRNQPLYFIVGLRELKNASFKNAPVNDGPLRTSATDAPASFTLPIHTRRDSSMEIVNSAASGVFGLEVRKVQCRIGRPDEPHSIEDINFTWNYLKANPASREEDLQLSVGLDRALKPAELRRLAGTDDEDLVSDESYGFSDSE
ncbi:hypothetical protein AOQ84DRAFT_182453 [Glonium stellatum]|uniref:Uncharacterized protein n=1 Tax=Glonium stellatum TaxID=574774 RepID=A0A8E2F7Q7_9PEZI|nr:hypothetical protein AOQ84DRAFT_182453 [Glonium stellatum]